MKLVKEPLNHIISRKSFLTVPSNDQNEREKKRSFADVLQNRCS